jgi:enterochelin esterase-like enzyme
MPLSHALATIVLFVAVAIASAAPAAASPQPRTETQHFTPAAFAPERVRVDIHLPPGYDPDTGPGYPLLYLHDGQDMPAVGLRETLADLYKRDAIRPVIVAAIHMLPDRMGTYGLSDRQHGRALVAETKYGPVGARAHDYAQWVANELVPTLDARYNTRVTPDARATLGWSLGALAAFNLGWQYPDLFARVGMFSPSLWLSAQRDDAEAVQRTRLAQRQVHDGPPRIGLKLFLGIGDSEDTDDRDGDGINDALDDARDFVLGWNPDGIESGDGLRGLAQHGYKVDADHATAPGRGDVALHLLPGGRHDQGAWAKLLPQFLRWAYARSAPPLEATGTTISWHEVASAHVPARNVDIWLPPGYADDPHARYPVLYMHDGQNLFDPALSYTGIDWGVDEAMTRLIEAGRIEPAIVVGIWNTPARFLEYMPRKPVRGAALESGGEAPPLPVERIASDAYLRFLVEELKPRIDAAFRTRPGRDDTLVAGSSMGALVSLYAAAEYPDVFGGVGAVSTHWPVGDGLVIDWLAEHLPDPATHRLWFDHGTATLDAQYAPYQQRMDAILRGAGYVEGDNWTTRVYEGAEHNEAAWRARIDEVLAFLLAD